MDGYGGWFQRASWVVVVVSACFKDCLLRAPRVWQLHVYILALLVVQVAHPDGGWVQMHRCRLR